MGLVFLFASCTEFSKLNQVDLSFSSTVTLPKIAAGVTNPEFVKTSDINTQIDTFMSVRSIELGSIQKISLKTLELSINAPTTANFDFLKTVEIYLVDGATEVKIASLTTIPATGLNTITVNVEPVDLKEYILKEKFALKFIFEADEATTDDYELTIKPVFLFELKVVGL